MKNMGMACLKEYSNILDQEILPFTLMSNGMDDHPFSLKHEPIHVESMICQYGFKLDQSGEMTIIDLNDLDFTDAVTDVIMIDLFSECQLKLNSLGTYQSLVILSEQT